MTDQNPLRQISIDELIPGMYIVKVDVPWYQTPFLSHRRLIENTATIHTMRRCGIRKVTIDRRKGQDVPEPILSAGESTMPDHEKDSAVPPVAIDPLEQADSADAFYAAAEEAVGRIFDQLMEGSQPPSAAAKAVVSQIMQRILSDRDGLMTQLAIRKITRFDRSLASHGLDTCILSLVVSADCGLDHTKQLNLGTGALLHDAGYVQLPRNLVRRRDECTEQERTLLQQHPRLGITVLSKDGDFPEEVKRIVLEHHERANGSGFPDGRAEAGISDLAQIVGIVDWYDGMVSRRGGRAAMLPNDAVRQLYLSGEQGQFRAALVESIVRVVGVFPVGSLVLLNTGEQAIVISPNPGQRLKPVVWIIGGPRGESYPKPKRIDLAAPSEDRTLRTIARALNPAHERINVAMYFMERPEQAA
jgi:HD-GYP domain-containing protein (c-di-GMP phosphodiesterase class II)